MIVIKRICLLIFTVLLIAIASLGAVSAQTDTATAKPETASVQAVELPEFSYQIYNPPIEPISVEPYSTHIPEDAYDMKQENELSTLEKILIVTGITVGFTLLVAFISWIRRK